MTRRHATSILMLMLAITAITAATAFATTKKGEIVRAGGGKPTLTKFGGWTSKSSTIQTAAGGNYECTTATITGTISSTTTATAKLTFTGCFSGLGKCKTAGAANAGEIVLPVTLLGATTASKQRDLVLNNIAQTTLECGSIGNIKIRGSIFVKVDKEEILSTKNVLEARATGPGEQEPEETTNHLESEFPKKAWENASLESNELNTTFEEQVEAV